MRSFRTLALLAATAIPAAAYADVPVDYFTITGGGNTLTFTLPASPTPSSSYTNVFYLDGVSVVLNGQATTDDFGFFTSSDFGGFEDNIFGDPFSAALFDDNTANPTFTPGEYTFTDGGVNGDISGTVLISTTPTSNTPEPSSLFLLGTGALGLAGAIRRRIA